MSLEPARIPDLIRFGQDFELDFRSRQLRRSGRVLKLERIPTDVLLFLVQKRGEIVTRDQIVETIWGKGVFLDTDNSINGAIRKVRQVLKDDPEQPRFIQTVTGHGYRFIAPVIEPGEEVTAAPVLPAVPQPLTTHEAESAKPAHWKRLVTLIASVALVVLVVAYLQWFRSPDPPTNSGGRIMLAVLPFDNLTGDPNQDYFSDGMTEELITQLGSLSPEHLGVIARTSVMHYKHSSEPLEQIGRGLAVQYVVQGSVRRDANKVRITAQLIQMKDQTHLWARAYDRESKDLLALQAEIAHQIADAIQIALGNNKPLAPKQQQSLSPVESEAYDLYLRGLYFWNKRTGFQQAISYFQQAIAKDPNNARAYAGLANAYSLLGEYSGVNETELVAKARVAALRAIAIDENLAEAHTAWALIVQNFDYDWQTSEKEFKRAIELNPNYATAHHWYAEHLMWRGRFEEALRESELARQLDPLSVIIAADNCAILYYSRQYDRAIEKCLAVREMDPNAPGTSALWKAFVQKGMYGEALADLKKLVRAYGDGPWALSELAYVYGSAGQQAQAERELAKLQDWNLRQPLDPNYIIHAYVGIGNKDQVFFWLEKAYELHSGALTGLKVNPEYDSLRSDPRFQNLLRRVGLAE